MISLRIINGRVICPRSGLDGPATVDLVGEQVAAVWPGTAPEAPGAQILDAAGQVVCPGFVDLHAELGEPGGERRETLDHALRAAAKGGFTAVCASPLSDPQADNPAVIRFLIERSQAIGAARMLPVGALSVGCRGERLAELLTLAEAGAVAFGDGDRGVADASLLRRAMEYARATGRPVFERPEDRRLAGRGCMHEGAVATRLGLPGVPAAAEDVAVWRAIALVEQTGAPIHLGPLSSLGAVRALRLARSWGLPVTGSVSANHLHLSDAAVAQAYDPNLRLRPPLRSARHREALSAALADGTLDAVTSQHCPQTAEDKQQEFDRAAPGAIGLETALGLTLRWAREAGVSLSDAVARLGPGPAAVLGRVAALIAGAPADLVVFDPLAHDRVEAQGLLSKARNTPWLGEALPGRVAWTVVAGRVVYAAPALR